MNHTAQLAISINGQILSDDGRRLQALILPLIVVSFWLPDRLYLWFGQGQPYARRTAAYLAGWRDDLLLICAALYLLSAERRFHRADDL